MNLSNRIKIDVEHFIQVCKTSISMREASKTLCIKYDTLKHYAIKHNCFKTNQSGKGIKKPAPSRIIPLSEILDGKHPQYQTYKLKNRLLKEGLVKNKCEVCSLKEWQGKPLNMELHHKDGNNRNHKKENLQMICPNCHAQTDTYRALNKKSN